MKHGLNKSVCYFKEYGSSVSLYFAASLIPMALSLVTNPWIAKNMSPEDYAISGYYASFTPLISPIIIFYMLHYYIKEYFRRSEHDREQLMAVIAKATVWFSGLMSLICFFALYVYLKYFKGNLAFAISPYLALMVFALPLTGLLNLQLSQYRMQKRAKAFFLLSVGNGILNIMITVLFVVLLKWGAFGKLLGPLVCNFLVFVLMVVMFRKYLLTKTTLREFQHIFVFCLPLAVSAMLGFFTNGYSTNYLECVGDTTEYGYYIVGASIGGYLTVFSAAVGSTFQADQYESIIHSRWKKYVLVLGAQLGGTLLIVLVFIVLAPYIISLLTAGLYVSSTPYAQIIALSAVTSTIYYLVNNFSIVTNHPKLYLYTSLLGSAFIVLAMPWAVDAYGYYGGAWMSVFSFIAFAIINVLLLLCVYRRRIIHRQ